MVHGRARELRVIGAFAAGLDPTTLVVSGLSGIGKTVTVLAALRRVGGQASAVRIVRSCTPRPYAEGLTGRRRLDLARWVVGSGAEPEHGLDPEQLVEVVTTGLADSGPGPRVLFVDDVGVLSPDRAGWLERLGEVAYEYGWRVVAAVRQVEDVALADDLELLELGPLDVESMRRCLDTAMRQPVATDVAERLHRWSAGNPRVALELADALGPGQLRGSAGWSGPRAVGPAARRAYRTLLDGLTPAQAAQHPLLALLRQEQAAGTNGGVPPTIPEPEGLEAVLEGLHLDELPAEPAARHGHRATARAVGVALLTGAAWTGATGLPDQADTAWTDHLWWRDPGPLAGDVRASGARVATELLGLEAAGHVSDAARLRADLDVIGATPGQHWVGVHLQVRGRLLLGDVAGAHGLLEHTGAPAGRTAAEVVARDLARAAIALVEGRAADVRRHLDEATGLRPHVAEWLPARGLRLAADAMLEGRAPASETPPRAGSPSTRALGEFAADVGLAHLAVGQVERAAELLTIALERCSWPYRGRAHVRADLVEAAVAGGEAGHGIPARVRRLIEPPVGPDELADADAFAAQARMDALLAGPDALADGPDGLDDWLFQAPRPASLWQRLRSLVAWTRHGLARGQGAAWEPLVREAQALAPLAGAPGWSVAVEAVPRSGTGVGRTAWALLGDNEREIVRLALGGATNAQIASAAYLSVRSVANRLRGIYALLGLRDRRDLVERAQTDPPGWLTDSA